APRHPAAVSTACAGSTRRRRFCAGLACIVDASTRTGRMCRADVTLRLLRRRIRNSLVPFPMVKSLVLFPTLLVATIPLLAEPDARWLGHDRERPMPPAITPAVPSSADAPG